MTEEYPWRQMKDGDSFRVEGSDPQLRQTLRSAGYQWLKNHSETHSRLRVIVRKEGDDAYRVWMVSKNWQPSFPFYGESVSP